jgi:2-keto-4-pentenoate hydratase
VLAGEVRRYERDGDGSAVLGDPRVALTWQANELMRLGMGLATGQFVTTGTCMMPLAIEPGDWVIADFGVLGQVSARFTD